MIDKFPEFRNLMEKHWKEITKNNPPIFEVDIDKSAFYQLYLDSFPEGTNPIYRQRREFDCSCCHHFINQVGSVMVYSTNGWTSIWDFEAPYPYSEVCKVMSAELRNHSLRDIFYIDSKYAGTKYSTEYKGVELIRWDHFFLDIPDAYVRERSEIPGLKSDFLDSKNVFYRTMREITLDAMEIVYDLICAGSLYRGDEWKTQIAKLIELKHIYDDTTNTDRNSFIWTTPTKIPASLARIRNSSIGTLLINLSEGMEVENAVRAYEQVVAPANYKRSKPIFTKKMLEQAQKDITNLGYLDSLTRRYATLDDIKITNVLFANRDVRAVMNAPANPFEALASKAVSKPKNFDNLREVKIEDFIKDILPSCGTVEAYLDNRLTSNLCSLIAPVNANSKCMFKWNNNFSWAYTGNITDSQIRENVKMAGGKVDGVLRFSIQWNDQDYNPCDYDVHCREENGDHIYFGHKCSISRGELDVDIISPMKGKPAVENIIYPSLERMPDGEYNFFVHCYSQGGDSRTGFRAEIEMNGQTYQYDYPHYLKDSERVNVAIVEKKNGKLILKQEFISSTTSARKVWNLTTNEFVPVSLVCYSPNYWEEPGIGNKHYFFMLKNCVSDESPNGFYNEFLNQELNKNRKVLEALGAQMAVQPIDNPLCGLGFSSTKRNSLVVKVDSQYMRIVF